MTPSQGPAVKSEARLGAAPGLALIERALLSRLVNRLPNVRGSVPESRPRMSAGETLLEQGCGQ